MVSRDDQYGVGPPMETLIVETRSLMSNDPRRFVETYEVHKPIAIGRQRDQLLRTVTEKHPMAELSAMEDGIAIFFTRTEMIIASYEGAGSARAELEFDQSGSSVDIPL